MIIGMKYRITTDSRGKITSGKKSEQGYPQALGYFDISDFKELETWYGKAPEKLLLYFPVDNIQDFFDCNFVAWGGKTGNKSVKKRQCNGETCIHRIDESINGTNYVAGSDSACVCQAMEESDKNRCKYCCQFKAYIGDPVSGKINNPACYIFETHSQNSGDAIYSELEKIKYLTEGSLRNVPFILSVTMCQSSKTAGKKFPIWKLQVLGLLTTIKDCSPILGIRKPLQLENNQQ